MIRILRISVLCVICVICGCGFACQNQDPYRQAAAAAADFSAALKTFQDSEIVLHQAGDIPDAEHIAIQRILLDTARAGKQLDQAVRVSKSSPDAWAAANAAIDAIGKLSDEGLLHIKSDKVRAELAASLALARIALTTIQSVLPPPAAVPPKGA